MFVGLQNEHWQKTNHFSYNEDSVTNILCGPLHEDHECRVSITCVYDLYVIFAAYVYSQYEDVLYTVQNLVLQYL